MKTFCSYVIIGFWKKNFMWVFAIFRVFFQKMDFLRSSGLCSPLCTHDWADSRLPMTENLFQHQSNLLAECLSCWKFKENNASCRKTNLFVECTFFSTVLLACMTTESQEEYASMFSSRWSFQFNMPCSEKIPTVGL